MTGRAVMALFAIVLGVVCCVGALIGISGASACAPTINPGTATSASSGTAASASTPPGTSTATTAPPDLTGYDRDQLANAATITTVGAGRGIPTRGLVIAVATAIQESSLRNLDHLGDNNDHDSIGLFQQRPSQGWGTPQQLRDSIYASNKFYDKLLTIPHWEQLPLTEAAQAVQGSATASAYAKWEADATALVAVSYGMSGGCTGGDGMSGAGAPLPADFALPVNTPDAVARAIFWALAQMGTPYTFGGSCTDPHSGDPSKQCDCSSLMQQAYRNGGISLPRVTDDQQHVGTQVAAVADLLPGDLIFIPGSDGSMSDPGHVGMYIGDGLLIQAPHTGDVVKLSKPSAWSQIATIRRVVTWPPAVTAT
jgi:cell wall-associated NlpC family hydrolase